MTGTKPKIDEALWAECQKAIPHEMPESLPSECGKIRGMCVCLVDGDEVKVKHDMDFVDGANDLELKGRYGHGYIPDKTFWLDAALLAPEEDLDEKQRSELAYVLYHEAHERGLMAKGWTYDKAHVSANVCEKQLRQRGLKSNGVTAKKA